MVEASRALVLDVLAGRAGPLPDNATLAPTANVLRRHGLAGLAYVWATERGERGAKLAQDLEPVYRSQQLVGSAVQESAARALDALSAAKIPALVFKGAALVRSGIYTVGERPMDDADLLVPPDSAAEAVRVLSDAGFEPWSPWAQGRERWSDSFTLRDSAAPEPFACDVDLHWRTEYGSLRFGAGGSLLWAAPLGPGQVPAPEAHLLIIAEHFLKHLRVRPHLLAYADLSRLCAGIASWDTFEKLAQGRWWTPAVGVLLEVLRDDLSVDIPSSVSDCLVSARPRVRRFSSALRPGTHLSESAPGRLGGVGQRWKIGPSSVGLVRDLWGAVFPPRDWLQARYGAGPTAGLRLRHGGAVLRWAAGRGASPLSPNQEAPQLLPSGVVLSRRDPVDTPMGRL